MAFVPLRDPSGKQIKAWGDWSEPKRKAHWKAGRSAMELAKAWFRTPKSTCPEELIALLESHPGTRGITLTGGAPEQVTPLPERGEGRNHDLCLKGKGPTGGVTLCIEAKADETFGERLGKQLQVARKRQPRTGAPARARALLALLFGRECTPEAAPWRDLRYQLITAAAGTALQAKLDGSSSAILVIHEFHSTLTTAARLSANQADLEAFLALLAPGQPTVTDGVIVGPIMLPPSPYLPTGMPLYVGKVVTVLGAAEPRP